MRKQQKIILFIALIYLVYQIIRFMTTLSFNTITSVVPGWHTTIMYQEISNHPLIIVYFLAVSALYGRQVSSFANSLFWIHIILSLTPLVAIAYLMIAPRAVDFDINSVLFEFQFIKIVDWIFVLSQAWFVILFLYTQRVAEKMRTTRTSQNDS